MMENETLKQLVLAKGKELQGQNLKNGAYVHEERNFQFKYGIDLGGANGSIYFDQSIPDDSFIWPLVAQILDIETEMSIDEFELSMAIRQHYNDMQDAHDAGFDNGNENGIHMTKEQSWEAFIGDYGKEEMKQPVPIFDSHLHELCVALGWQGGTYHQVLAEVKRLKTFADEKRTESHC